MKVFALVLLCALVAVQARNTGLSSDIRVERGDAPFVVHLRYAIGTSGLLNTCTGTLISNRWVLTAASCVDDYRFGWFRFGAVDAIRPALVTEANLAAATPNLDPSGRLALININRNVELNDVIDAVSLDSDVGSSGTFYGYSDADSDSPGEALNRFDVELEENDGSINASGAAPASRFDLGAGLVSNNAVVAVLTGAGEGDRSGTFTPVDLEWVERVTGVSA